MGTNEDVWQPPRMLVDLFVEDLMKIRVLASAEDIARGFRAMFEEALKMAVDAKGHVRYTAVQLSMALSEALHDRLALPWLNIVGDPWVEESSGFSKRPRQPTYVEMICTIFKVHHVITAGKEFVLRHAPKKE